MKPYYVLRFFAGLLFLAGAVLMAVEPGAHLRGRRTVRSPRRRAIAEPVPGSGRMSWLSLHHRLERNTGLLIFGILLVACDRRPGPGAADRRRRHAARPADMAPYPALELDGRDIYIRESCSTCHTQQIRPLLAEVKRYGPYSRAEEFAYDRPFLWGSKRTGPDLHRVGGRTAMHGIALHLIDPRSVVPLRSCRLIRGLRPIPRTAAAASRRACARCEARPSLHGRRHRGGARGA